MLKSWCLSRCLKLKASRQQQCEDKHLIQAWRKSSVRMSSRQFQRFLLALIILLISMEPILTLQNASISNQKGSEAYDISIGMNADINKQDQNRRAEQTWKVEEAMGSPRQQMLFPTLGSDSLRRRMLEQAPRMAVTVTPPATLIVMQLAVMALTTPDPELSGFVEEHEKSEAKKQELGSETEALRVLRSLVNEAPKRDTQSGAKMVTGVRVTLLMGPRSAWAALLLLEPNSLVTQVEKTEEAKVQVMVPLRVLTVQLTAPLQLNLTQSICCLRAGMVRSRLEMVVCTALRAVGSVLRVACWSCALRMEIWEVYCACWAWQEAMVFLRSCAWVSMDWQLLWRMSLLALMALIWLLSLTLSALRKSMLFWVSVMVADSSRMRAWRVALLACASASCFWRLRMRASVLARDWLSALSWAVVEARVLVSLETDWRLAEMLRLQGVRSTLALLYWLQATWRVASTPESLPWRVGMPRLAMEAVQLAIWPLSCAICPWELLMMLPSCAACACLIAMQEEIFPRKSNRQPVFWVHERVLAITCCTVWVIVTLSPEFMIASNCDAVGRAVLDPVPVACRVITPAVEEGFPKVLAVVTREEEAEVESAGAEEEVRRVEEAGEAVAAPEAEKVKIWSQGQSPMQMAPPLILMRRERLRVLPRASETMALTAQVPPRAVAAVGISRLLPLCIQVAGRVCQEQVRGLIPPVTGMQRSQYPLTDWQLAALRSKPICAWPRVRVTASSTNNPRFLIFLQIQPGHRNKRACNANRTQLPLFSKLTALHAATNALLPSPDASALPRPCRKLYQFFSAVMHRQLLHNPNNNSKSRLNLVSTSDLSSPYPHQPPSCSRLRGDDALGHSSFSILFYSCFDQALSGFNQNMKIG